MANGGMLTTGGTQTTGAPAPTTTTGVQNYQQPDWAKRWFTPQQWNQFVSSDPQTQWQTATQAGFSYNDLQAFQTAAQASAAAQPLPEQNALGMMAQIDPTGEALRQQLGQSYLTQLQGSSTPTAPTMGQGPGFTGGQAPQAADVQSYLDLYKQIDPQGYAAHQALGTSMSDYVQQMQQQEALGTQLDPETVRELEQSTRQGQAARGNVYGTPQLVAEAMTRGQAGLAIQQQRQAQLAGALGQQQSYLGSGLGLGDIANTLYQQGYQRNLSSYQAQQQTAQMQNQQALNLYQSQLGARQYAQSGALGYLGSGQTPLQASGSYLSGAENTAGAAAQGGPQYNPSPLGGTYTGAGVSQFPQYGLDVSQLSNQWYNSMNAYNQPTGGGSGSGSKLASAGMGAAQGAIGGAVTGLAGGPVGALAGGAIGALGGAAKGYFS